MWPARRSLLVTAVVAAVALVVATGGGASAEAWLVVKKGPTVGPGELAFVGGIVRRPSVLAFRAVASKPGPVTLTVVMSCRSGLKTRVGRQRLSGRATYTKPVRLPLGGADHCAVSATGASADGTLRLELLRSA